MDDDPIRAFVYRADAYNKAQLGWPRNKDGSSSVLALAGMLAFIAEPGDLQAMRPEELVRRLEAAEHGIREAADAYFGGPRPGGLADSLRKARLALKKDPSEPIRKLSESLEGSNDSGTNALLTFMRGLQARKEGV
jgi:hypothetical protein